MSKYTIEDIINMSLSQGMTEDDVAHLRAIDIQNQEWKSRAGEEDKTSSANSNNQQNKHKNQDKDTEKILTIYDSKFYSVMAEKGFRRLNPYRDERSFKAFELFARYCVWDSGTGLSSSETNSFDLFFDELSKQIKNKHTDVCTVWKKVYAVNDFNVFVHINGVAPCDYDFATCQLDLRVDREYLQNGHDYTIQKLINEMPNIKQLYNLKN